MPVEIYKAVGDPVQLPYIVVGDFFESFYLFGETVFLHKLVNRVGKLAASHHAQSVGLIQPDYFIKDTNHQAGLLFSGHAAYKQDDFVVLRKAVLFPKLAHQEAAVMIVQSLRVESDRSDSDVFNPVANETVAHGGCFCQTGKLSVSLQIPKEKYISHKLLNRIIAVTPAYANIGNESYIVLSAPLING